MTEYYIKISKEELFEMLEMHKARGMTVNLKKYDLSGFDLKNLSLEQANLSHANLSGANLKGSFLHCANLSHANLSGANLQKTHLGKANLSYANLSGANLKRSYLSDSNFNEANISNTILCDSAISYAHNLDKCKTDKVYIHLLSIYRRGTNLLYCVDDDTVFDWFNRFNRDTQCGSLAQFKCAIDEEFEYDKKSRKCLEMYTSYMTALDLFNEQRNNFLSPNIKKMNPKVYTYEMKIIPNAVCERVYNK